MSTRTKRIVHGQDPTGQQYYYFFKIDHSMIIGTTQRHYKSYDEQVKNSRFFDDKYKTRDTRPTSGFSDDTRT